MPSRFWPQFGVPGILHHYASDGHLVAFEYTSHDATPKPNTILFVGGLSDGLSTTSYTADLIKALESTSWSFFTVTLSSSYDQWGVGRLDVDTNEIAACLKYIKGYKHHKYSRTSVINGSRSVPNERGNAGKLVLMGHSTGSQMVLHYLYSPSLSPSNPALDTLVSHSHRQNLDGAIMQAPVSDREAVLSILQTGFDGKSPDQLKAVYSKLKAAMLEDSLHEDQSTDVLVPLSLTTSLCYSSTTPITFRRLRSLISPNSPAKPGEDDLFSSDLSDEHLETTFGTVGRMGLLGGGLLVLMSGNDASVPPFVDKQALVNRWRKAVTVGGQHWDESSGVIEGASHALSDEDQAEPRQKLCKRVLEYVKKIEDE